MSEKETTIEASIQGPTMAWVLSHAVATKEDDETHAVFGQLCCRQKEGDITDAKAAGNISESTEIKIKFVTKLPLKVWNPKQKHWDHDALKEWEAKVIKIVEPVLGKTKVIGIARFRRSDLSQSKPFSMLDVKLCQSVSRTAKIPMVLMAINSPANQKEGEENSLITTRVLLAYFDDKKCVNEYLNLKVRNMGEETLGFAKTDDFSPEISKPLVPLKAKSQSLLAELQAVQDEYQKKQLALVSQLALPLPETSKCNEEGSEGDGSSSPLEKKPRLDHEGIIEKSPKKSNIVL